MYKRILVPVDKSETSHLALKEAAKLAESEGSILRLINVIDLAQFAWGANEFVDVSQLQQELRDSANSLLTGLKAQISDVPNVDTSLVEVWGGALAKGIVDESKNWQADIIVMGTHGYSGLSHLLLGSVAEGVMRATTVPILLIRSRGESKKAQ